MLTAALPVVVQNFVENFSEFSAAQRNAGKHVTIMSELSRVVDARTLMQVHLPQASLSLFNADTVMQCTSLACMCVMCRRCSLYFCKVFLDCCSMLHCPDLLF